jgi:hypothetical protein
MARYWDRTDSASSARDRICQTHGTATGWLDVIRLTIEWWRGEGLRDIVQLWTGAKDAVEQPLMVRVRAATALDPLRP